MTHPITPPPELVQQLAEQAPRYRDGGVGREVWLINRAYSAGADQELEACCHEVQGMYSGGSRLRAARRPEPPTLHSIALQMLGTIERDAHYIPEITDTIRKALEQLRALEALTND
jgi:hypothetical protein